MPNLLTLKAIAYDTKRNVFISPSRQSFEWVPNVVVAQCNKCENPDQFNPDCTHGIYSSPNPQALEEYSKHKNTALVLMQTFGWTDIWPGPHDIPEAYILRSWGVQILGVVIDGWTASPTEADRPLSAQRQLTATTLLERFPKAIAYPWFLTKAMLEVTWTNGLGFSPFKLSAVDAPAFLEEMQRIRDEEMAAEQRLERETEWEYQLWEKQAGEDNFEQDLGA